MRSKLDYWKTGRKIITSTTGTDQIAFTWTGLTPAQKAAIDPYDAVFGTGTDPAIVLPYASPVLNHLRGNRSDEVPAIGNLRKRFNLLSDIQGATPVFVGPPTANFTLPGYPRA